LLLKLRLERTRKRNNEMIAFKNPCANSILFDSIIYGYTSCQTILDQDRYYYHQYIPIRLSVIFDAVPNKGSES
jgi:hypothetical protein